MNKIPGRSRQWFEVQRHLGQVHVARQSGDLPRPQPGQALLKMVACGICGADIRVVSGDKSATGKPDRFTVLGHEGVGRIIALNEDAAEFHPGDYVVILPHVGLTSDHCNGPRRLDARIDPVAIGSGQTLHMGWDIDGCFADFVLVPTTNVVRVARKHLHRASEQAPGLCEAIFALTEPMLCVLSAYELMEVQSRALQRGLAPGRALVIGCGPIGILHSLALLERGYEIWLLDSLRKRAELARWCLGGRGRILDPAKQGVAFDLVMVTASSADAVRTGEDFVRDGGIVYLFAGLNAVDRAAMDRENIFFYERLHRTAQGILTPARLTPGGKSILYLGHSGYFEHLASEALATVATNAAALDRAVTGVIDGFASPRIVSRLPGGVDWIPEDKSPAVVSVLKGIDLRDRHCKLLVLAEGAKYS